MFELFTRQFFNLIQSKILSFGRVNVVELMEFVFHGVENYCGKQENYLFPKTFSKGIHPQGCKKLWLCGKEL